MTFDPTTAPTVHATTALPRPRKRLQLALFGFFFFAYLLSGSRALPWSDGKFVQQVADSLVHRQAVDIDSKVFPGRDGKFYGVHPIAAPLMQVPGVLLHKIISENTEFVEPNAPKNLTVMTSHLGPAALGALTALLLFRLLWMLGVTPALSAFGALLYGLGTFGWMYARYPYSEITQVAAFTGFFGAVVALDRRPRTWGAVAAGLWAGFLINTKLVYVLVLPGAIGWLAWQQRHQLRLVARLVGLAALGLLPGVLVTLAYNHARWGSFWKTGYPEMSNAPAERLYVGLWGLFLSPSKSLFVYAPPLLLTLLALRRMDRTRQQLLTLLLLTAGPIVLLIARLPFWSGDYAWGPRYLVFLTAAALVPGILWLQGALAGARRRLVVATAATVATVALAVQLISNALYWDVSVRMTQTVRNDWLGHPNRSGSFYAASPTACAPCFEDFFPILYLPPFHPLEVHWWVLRHLARDSDWREAEKDAPWRRYTKLNLNIADPYARAHLDWWYIPFHVRFRPVGIPLLATMIVGTIGCALLWWRGSRRKTPVRETPRP